MNTSNAFNLVQASLQSQIEILRELSDSQAPAIVGASTAIHNAHHVVTTGVGKSAYIAQKLSASLVSIGCDARFLHPTDALHGDIGIVRSDTVLVVFSKSGSTAELMELAQLDQLRSTTRVVITANPKAPLHRQGDHIVVIPVSTEYDADNLLPTASTTASMAVADLLVAVAGSFGSHTRDVLRMTHPRGTIGRLLLTRVGDLLSSLPSAPTVGADSMLVDAIGVLHAAARGIVCGTDHDGRLIGILTDGDVRRIVRSNVSIVESSFLDVASRSPVSVTEDSTLHDAMRLMEERASKIAVLPIVSTEGMLLGVIHLHDIVSYQFSNNT